MNPQFPSSQNNSRIPIGIHAKCRFLFRVSAPNPHPSLDLHGFHRTYPGIMPGKPDLPWDLQASGIQFLFRVSAPNHHPPWDFAWFHSEFIQGSCKKEPDLPSDLHASGTVIYSESVLPTLIPNGICIVLTGNSSRDHARET